MYYRINRTILHLYACLFATETPFFFLCVFVFVVVCLFVCSTLFSSPVVTFGDLVILVILCWRCLIQIYELASIWTPLSDISVETHSHLCGRFWYNKPKQTKNKKKPNQNRTKTFAVCAVLKGYPPHVPVSREEGVGCALKGSSFFSF